MSNIFNAYMLQMIVLEYTYNMKTETKRNIPTKHITDWDNTFQVAVNERHERERERERERGGDPTFIRTPQPAGLSLQPSLQSPFFVSIGLCLIHYINSNFDISRVRDIGVGEVFQIEIDNVFYIMC